ncbi:MAG: tyrosine-protein phosphatase [Hyphomonadaceae bacterium]|nr:tyrosine-protein phosphatase [Hyphomonadaceae bacterium]
MRDRLVEFERVANFRDFGGYDTPDGKLVRGRLFRSASFHDASDADIERLNALGARLLVDLRRPEERAHEPNRWPGEAVPTVFHDDGAGDITALPPHLMALMQADLNADALAAYMHYAYRSFPFEERLIQPYRAWFRGLIEGEGPAIIHCAAGKDRTGLGCALTLFALGVSDDDVFADYEFTNQAVDLEGRFPRIQAAFEKRIGRMLDIETLRPILGVREEYLNIALDEIRAKHGSIETYLEHVLGVGPSERAAMRQRLLA